MILQIKIDEERISEMVSQAIADQIMNERSFVGRDAKYGVREGVDKAIKQYIYNQKDAIIDRVVNRATAEIVRKGMPKLIERLALEETE